MQRVVLVWHLEGHITVDIQTFGCMSLRHPRDVQDICTFVLPSETIHTHPLKPYTPSPFFCVPSAALSLACAKILLHHVNW